MNTQRYEQTATLLPNGKVLMAGAVDAGLPLMDLQSAEIFDPSANTWTFTGDMTTAALEGSSATLLRDGTVLVAGGTSGKYPVSDAEVYDPTTGTWTATASMTATRSGHTATLLPSGAVLAAGGRYDNTAEIYE